MFNINPIQIAMTAVGGPLGGVLGSIMGQMTGGGDPGQLLQSVMKAFDGIFKGGSGAKGQMPTPFAPQPLPFSSGPGGVAITIQSPLNALQQGVPAGIEQLSKMMGDILGKLQGLTGNSAGIGSLAGATAGAGALSAFGGASGSGASSPASSGGSASAPASTGNSGGWGNIDSMMSQAESLMNSDKPSDQLKAQQLMQKAQRMFEMISKMMEQRSQMMSKAIQAIK